MSQLFSKRSQVLVGNLSNYNTSSIIGAKSRENSPRKGFGNINRWGYVRASSILSVDQGCEGDSKWN